MQLEAKMTTFLFPELLRKSPTRVFVHQPKAQFLPFSSLFLSTASPGCSVSYRRSTAYFASPKDPCRVENTKYRLPSARIALSPPPPDVPKNQMFSFRHLPPTPPSCQPASPELRQHVSLPRTARRLGRRPYHSPGPTAPSSGSPTGISAPSLAVAGAGGSGGSQGGGSQGGGSASADWDVTSPPEVPGRRPGFGVGDGGGVEPGFAGEAGGGGGGILGEGIRGCAEWAVSFSGHLEQGITTVKARGAAARPRMGSLWEGCGERWFFRGFYGLAGAGLSSYIYTGFAVVGTSKHVRGALVCCGKVLYFFFAFRPS